MRLTLAVPCLIAARSLSAQALPAGPQRVWFELGVGGATQHPNCSGCAQKTGMGGPTASAALGATITPRFGVAALVREFAEFSFEESHSANYVIGLGQYLLNRGDAVGITVNAGLGYGAQHGDQAPYGDNGGGLVLAGGWAMRMPSTTTFALTLDFDLMKSVSGKVRTTTGPGSSYHPLLFTIALGLNIAGSSQK